MIQGSCLCGKITFNILGEPTSASHCHCTMCQKQHGAAYASYLNVVPSDLVYVNGEEHLSTYVSSGRIERKFCAHCGANIEWRDPDSKPAVTGIALGVLDEVPELGHIREIYTDTKAKWGAKNP